MSTRLISTAAITVLLLSFVPHASADGEPEKRTMVGLLDGLNTAFRLSLDPDEFAARSNRKKLRRALERLAQQSEMLALHGEEMGRSTNYVRSALARDADRVLLDFTEGRLQSARWRVRQLTDHCFACHTRLPGRGSALADGLSETVDLESLELDERITFLAATRRFDEAVDAAEQALRSGVGLDRGRLRLFENYLKLALRVGGSYEEAARSLRALPRGKDTPRYLTGRVDSWTAALQMLEKSELKPDLKTARELIEQGRLENEFPADRRGLVHFVAASGLLFRLLERDEIDREQEAAAYLELGIAESYISSTLQLDQTESFLETAIRLAPHTPTARRAHRFLHEYVVAQYSGASSENVPEAVREHLADLAGLAE